MNAPRAALVAAGLLGLTGCGYGLAIGIGAAVASGGGGKKGGSTNQSSAVAAAQILPVTTAATVVLEFTVADPEGDAATVEIRASTDVNESAVLPFMKIATGVLRDGSGNPVALGSVPTSATGVTYRFTWDTAADVGAALANAARLQILIGRSVAFTTASFVVDNTQAPVIVLTAPGPLPAGATTYADEQNASAQNPGGFIPITVTVADAESTPVGVEVRFSTDGGQTFPATNVAAGKFVDGGGSSVPPTAVKTLPGGGLTYTFQFTGLANGLGVAGSQIVALQFTARDTKTSMARATTTFAVNNAAFAVLPNTPTLAQISDKVDVPFQVTDVAGEAIEVGFEFALGTGAPVNATGTSEPPATGTPGGAFPSSATGIGHHFVWNAARDLPAVNGVFVATNARLFLTARRPSTRVTKARVGTNVFGVDLRLLQTVFGRNPGAELDGTNALAATFFLDFGGVASLGSRVFFADALADRVRVVDLSTGLVDTFLGGGTDNQAGALAKNFRLIQPRGVTTSPLGFGAVFVSARNPQIMAGGDVLLRVDIATPDRVTQLYNSSSFIGDLAFDRSNNVYFVEGGPQRVQVIPAGGGAPFTVFGGGGTQLVDGGPGVPATNVTVSEIGGLDIDARTGPYEGILWVIDRSQKRLVAVNVSGDPTYNPFICGIQVNQGEARVILPSGSLADVQSTSFDASVPILRITAPSVAMVLGLPITPGGPPVVSPIVGDGVFGFAGDGGPAANARCFVSAGIGLMGPNDWVFSDLLTRRLRRIDASGIIRTIAGTSKGPGSGDGLPAINAKLLGPQAVDVAPSGAILVTDVASSLVRSFAPTTTIAGTVAGSGDSGFAGDGGPALQANIIPFGLAAAPSGELFIGQLDIVRRVSANGVITFLGGQQGVLTPTTVPGPAATSPVGQIRGIALAGGCLAIAQISSLVSAINVSNVTTTCCGVSIPPGFISVIAGDPTLASPIIQPTNGVNARMCSFVRPQSVTCAKDGTVYVCDQFWEAVFALDAATGTVTVIAGTPGTRGPGPDQFADSPALGMTYDRICGILLEPGVERILYIATAGDNDARIHAVNLTAGPVTVHGVTIGPGMSRTIAGNGQKGDGGDGIEAVFAQINNNRDFGHNPALDAQGNLYFVQDRSLRFVDTNGLMHTFAGPGPDGDGKAADAAQLTRPTALAVAPDGTYAVADLGRVRLVPPASTAVTRVAGTGQQLLIDGGPAANAAFVYSFTSTQSSDVVADANGPRQLAFSGVAPATSLLAIADTLGGRIRIVNLGATPFVNATLGLTVAPGAAGTVVSGLAQPEGVVFAPSGLLFYSETGANTIAAINLTGADVVYGGQTFTSGVPQALATGALRSPRNLAFETASSLLIFAQDSPGEVSAFNPGPALFAYYATPLPATGVGTISFMGQVSFSDQVRGVTVDPRTGDVYFAIRSGPNAHTVAIIQKTNPFFLNTICGSGGFPGVDGDGGVPANGHLDSPCGVGCDASGFVHVLDARNLRVRRFRLPP